MLGHVLPLLATAGAAAPPWRNDTANLAVTAALNAYLGAVPFTSQHDGTVTDARPVRLDWDVAGDMPHALKDGVACWFPPGPGRPEGQVLVAGGLWTTGIAHMPGTHSILNRSYEYDVATGVWTALPPPPFTPGRTQGACLQKSRALVIISGGDGGTIGSRVLRLAPLTASPGGRWGWDTRLPQLPAHASRITGSAHSIDDRWLLIGMGASKLSSDGKALPGYKLDLQQVVAAGGAGGWERIAPYPLTAIHPQQLIVPISASVGGKWLVFGGQVNMGKDAAAAWERLPRDIAAMESFAGLPTGPWLVREAYSYDPTIDEWEALPKMPFNMVQGPKHAPVVSGRYVLLLGAQRRLSARRGYESLGYMAAVNRPPIDSIIDYYGDDALVYDTVERVYGCLGKVPYGVVTASWVSNGTHVLGFGGEPMHGWSGNAESVIQRARTEQPVQKTDDDVGELAQAMDDVPLVKTVLPQYSLLPPPNMSAPERLQYMSAYGYTNYPEQQKWLNVLIGDCADLTTMIWAQERWPHAGLQGWPQPSRSIFGKESKEGGTLPSGWESNVSAFVRSILPAVLNQSVSGVFVGDEIVCSGIPQANFDTVVTELRRQVLQAIASAGKTNLKFFTYANECEPVFDDPHFPRDKPMITPALDFISLDMYDANGTREVERVKSFLGNHVYPKLHAHQRVFLVPGVFANDPDDCIHHSADPRSCATVAEQDAENAKKMQLYWEWAAHDQTDRNIAGFNPWHYGFRAPMQTSDPKADGRLGAENLTLTRHWLAAIGSAIKARHHPHTHHVKDG